MFEGGYLTLGRLRGAPVRVHWSAPVGALFLGQFRFVPGFWLAFIGLILAHEVGHALMVSASGARVRGIDVTGLGGQCHYEGSVTPMRSALIAWGGVLAQLGVLLVAGALLLAFGSPESAFVAEVADACIFYNLMLMGINLIPFGPLDGREAWKIVPLLRARWKASRARATREPEVYAPTASSPAEVYARAASSPAAATPLPRTHSPELEVQRLREILERAPRRR
jgi:stage IV sporulation protein FB